MENPYEKINQRFDTLERLILEIRQVPMTEEEKKLNIIEAATFLGKSVQTIRRNIRKIPHHKRLGSVYFLKTELLEYIKKG